MSHDSAEGVLGQPPDSDRTSDVGETPEPHGWKLNLALFVATVLSVLFAGGMYDASFRGDLPEDSGALSLLTLLPRGAPFAASLLAILVTHELGHYVAARLHKVDASLPYFIPFPLVSPFGTMGAVIQMRGRIRSRDALLDIGASGPLAGLVVAIPVLLYGLSLSPVLPVSGSGVQEGQSLLYVLLKWIVLGPIPAGHDVFLAPVALAGWAGLLVTALNLLPVGQLDGGHVAYALFGPRQNAIARVMHAGLLLAFGWNVVRFLVPVVVKGAWGSLGQAFGNTTFWLFWFLLLHGMARFAGREHPPTEPGQLSPKRRIVAYVTLAFFVLLFMPTPWATY
jgi:membrane-associated protease RseP (regulator of RpoE activity)